MIIQSHDKFLTTDECNYLIDFYKNNREEEFSLNTVKEKERFSWKSFVHGVDELMISVHK